MEVHFRDAADEPNPAATTFRADPSANADRKSDAILLIYTGGTIGAIPSDRMDPHSPLTIAKWEEFVRRVPAIDELRSNNLRIDTVELDDPLDSTDLEPHFWELFADIIAEHYERYLGFVLLHGTDTMVFTASALSFMLGGGLDRPVVLTGSQVPIIDRPRTDGVRNLVNAIQVAAWSVFKVPKVPEVCIAFDNVLLRGNRARKVDATKFGGFASPNFAPLGRFDEDQIRIDTQHLRRVQTEFLPVFTLDPHVISLQLFPGIRAVLPTVLDLETVRGVVLQAYGTGNAPGSEAFLEPLGRAVVSGKTIVDVTQCLSGTVRLGQYETGVGLMARGVLSGSDMTPEAALCKLMVSLGRRNPNSSLTHDIEKDMQQNRAGEQSESLYTSHFTRPDGDAAGADESWHLSEVSVPVQLVTSQYDTSWPDTPNVLSAWLHLHDAVILAEDELTFAVFIGVEEGARPSQRERALVATVTREPTHSGKLISVEVTAGVARVERMRPPLLSLSLLSVGSLSFRRATLVVLVDERAQT